MSKAKKDFSGVAVAEPVNYAAAVLERRAQAQSTAAADLQFYREAVWKLAAGTATEEEVEAFRCICDELDEAVSPDADMDACRKLLDWKQSGNHCEGTPAFAEHLAVLNERADKLRAEFESARKAFVDAQQAFDSASASAKKYADRGRHWRTLLEQNPHLNREGR
jgi:hypothetical protein